LRVAQRLHAFHNSKKNSHAIFTGIGELIVVAVVPPTEDIPEGIPVSFRTLL
ncbi:unnamed protein product, partial [marine sediment metagenome]